MEEPRNGSTRYSQLALISKAFAHNIATSEVTRHALLRAFADASKPPTPPNNPDSLESKVAVIVNEQLDLNGADLALQPHEMADFDVEMQKCHSALANLGNFNLNSPYYSSRWGVRPPPPGTGQGLGESSTSSQQSGGNSENQT